MLRLETLAAPRNSRRAAVDIAKVANMMRRLMRIAYAEKGQIPQSAGAA
jgi:hypothetical protein